MSDTSSLSGPCLSLEWFVRFFFLTGIFSLSSSYLRSTVHPPPAAVACEAVHLSTTVDIAQAGIASSFLETESVSLLWWFIPWSRHRENVLFFQSQHLSGMNVSACHICTTVWAIQMCLSLEVKCLLSCLVPGGVVCKGEPSLRNRLSCIPCVGHRLSAIPAAWVPDNECLYCMLDYMNNPLIQLRLFND